MSLIAELKRRNVFKVGVAYLIVAWLLLQVLDIILPLLQLPEWVGTFFLLVLAVGLPLALVLSWAYEMTPEGIKKEKDVNREESITAVTGRKLDFLIIAVLAIALGFFVVDKYLLTESASESGTGSVADLDRSIAVLPFINMSSDTEQEFFSDGITEEILNTLVAINGLSVTGRTSAFAFKGKNENLTDIAEQLGVATILEGSVRKSGNRVRITAQLIRADNGFHLWSETYDRELTDIFDIQEEIASEIAAQLRLELGLGVAQFVNERRTDSVDAYTWLMRGHQYSYQASLENNINSVNAYRRALDYDPDYPAALTEYAISCLTIRSWGSEFPELCDIDPVSAVRRALEISPDSVEAQIAQAYIDLYIYNDMIRYRERLAGLADRIVDRRLLFNYAYSLSMAFAEYEESYRLYQMIYEQEPLDVNSKGLAAEALMRSGRLDEAQELLETSIALDPNYASNYYRLGYLMANYRGNFVEGIRNHRKNLALDPSSTFLWNDLAEWHLELDSPDLAARFVVPRDREDPEFLQLMNWYFIALYNDDRATRDRTSKRMADLAFAELDYHYLYYVAWLLDFQRQDPQEAFETYARLYPNLMRSSPVVGYWNHGAAIALAVLRQAEGDGTTAAYLLDQAYEVLVNDTNAFASPGIVAIHVLRGDIDAAIERIRFLVDSRRTNAWWMMQRIDLFEPLWDLPEFASLMSEIREIIAPQREAVATAESAGEFEPIPDRL